jgi:hypothetical protein
MSGKLSTCKYCGVDIEWVQQKNGLWIPINPVDGTIHDRGNGSCEVRTPIRVIVHYGKWPKALCGQWAGWFREAIKSTEDKDKVTCLKCLKKLNKESELHDLE